jgi:hypothetical protein
MNSKKNENFFLVKALNKFCNIYKIKNSELKNNDKIRFRFECFKYNYMMKHIDLPIIKMNSDWEAVLIEYRLFPHLEFLIRNAIFKLGSKWSFTVICGNLNFSLVQNICSKISKNIKIIKTNYNNLSQNDYSLFLSNINFWNLLTGSKILIYQEDSFIFKNNIEEFIEWDFIGAPWPKNTNDTPNCVGNGGISLRTKKIMIDIINKISIEKTSLNESTQIYMKKNNLTVCPEDVYFSLNMQKYNIGKVADFEIAFKFSSESLNNPNSFSGHNFWISDKNWIKRLQKNIKIYNYISNSNLQEYLFLMKKSSILNLTKIKNNAFDIDFVFYKKCNNIFIKNNKELSNHFLNYGMNGLIYHAKQLYNLYPSISIFYFLENIFILKEDKIYTLNSFINKFLYLKSFDYFNKLTIKNTYDNLSDTYSQLILLVFIGNVNIGSNLIEKIINYKNIQKFNISFCFNSNKIYEELKPLIYKNFLYFSIYFTHEYGTDIQPTILMYNDICKKHNFEYIIKLHTKSIENQYNELTDFLLNNTVLFLKKILNKNICNCVGPKKYYISLKNDIFIKNNLKKANSFIDVNKKFVQGTIFFTDNITFKKIIDYISKNDYKSFIFNNLYENNTINIDFSPTHFLERLFGIIN